MSDLKLTPASQWDSSELVRMPSGNVAKLRRLSALNMARDENIPNFLRGKIAQNVMGASQNTENNEDDVSDDNLFSGLDEKDSKQAIEMMIYMARQVFVYPVLVEGEPKGEDEVSIEMVSEDDLTFAVGYGIGDAEVVDQLNTFRPDANSDVEPVSSGEDLDEDTEQSD